MKSFVSKEIAMSEKNFINDEINDEINDDVEIENQSNEMWDACFRATEKINEYCSIIKENCNNPFSDLYCDFYEINNQVYFGELTFYPGAGMEEFYPEKYDRLLGDWIKLSCI